MAGNEWHGMFASRWVIKSLSLCCVVVNVVNVVDDFNDYGKK